MSDEDFEDFADFGDPYDNGKFTCASETVLQSDSVAFTDESDKKSNENSNTAQELDAPSNDILNDQINNSSDDAKPSQSHDEYTPSQNPKESTTQLQFRPLNTSLNMFSSPPPGFIRPPPGPPPLLNPNFFPPPNRFWGNTPPGMNVNQNKGNQQSNRWNSPSTFERQRFNRPPPDFGSNRRFNNDEDEDRNVQDNDSNNDESFGADEDNYDEAPPMMSNDVDDGESNQSEQSGASQNISTPKRHNPFSQMPRIPPNEEADFILNKVNNSRQSHDDMDQQNRFNSFRSDGPLNNQQSPAFNRNNNPNQQFNNQNFNNQINQFNQTTAGPQPLFSPQNMNFNSPMRGRGGGIRNDSPYFRPRGRGGGAPGMNRGNFRPNFRGNNRGSWQKWELENGVIVIVNLYSCGKNKKFCLYVL